MNYLSRSKRKLRAPKSPKLDETRRLKREKALRQLLTSEIQDNVILGIGSGSTMALFVELLAYEIRRGTVQNIVAVPTSYQIKLLLSKHGIPYRDPWQVDAVDIAIDGADQVNLHLQAIKGGGAALLMEKIVDSMSNKTIFVVEEEKLTDILNKPVPLEVLPSAISFVMRKVRELGGRPTLRIAPAGKVGPVVTDSGNVIIDVDFGDIRDPESLETKLLQIPGVLECGLFCNIAHSLYVGTLDGVRVYHR